MQDIDFMESVFELIEKSKKSAVRNYGDVKASEFGCGCSILTIVDEIDFAFQSICSRHRTEYEEKTGNSADRIMLKDKS